MSSDSIVVRRVETACDMTAFVRLPHRIYAGSPHWIAPLEWLVRKQLDFKRHPFWQHAEGALFLAEHAGTVVGRISAQINHNYIAHWHEPVGSFGFFECVDDGGVADALIAAAATWLTARDVRVMRGPLSPSSNSEYGFLAAGFDDAPAFMMPYTQPYYLELMARCGLHVAKEVWAYRKPQTTATPAGALRSAARWRNNPRVSIRRLSRAIPDEDVRIIQQLHQECWGRNWGYEPVSLTEAYELAHGVARFGHPELALIAYYDGEPVGFYIALPDINQVLRHMHGRIGISGVAKYLWYRRKITRCRTLLIGLTERFRDTGLVALLYCEADAFLRRHYAELEFGWVLDDNRPAQMMMEYVGGSVYKRYRVFEKRVGGKGYERVDG
jgi:hypothetical protein